MLDTYGRKYIQPSIDKIAHVLTRWNLTANHVTWAAFLIGSTTGVLIVLDQLVAAVIVLWFSGLLDVVDGSMARMQNKTSAWGTLMDITFDRVVECSVIIGLAIRFPQAMLPLLLLTVSIVLSMTIFLTVGALTEKKGIKTFYYQAGLAERTEGFILFSIMILFPSILVWTTILFLIIELFTVLQRMLEARKILL
ncbi:CDP-alcohol phosphatidyltransferase family protein [Longirhabdus pacifica]|uniref:CDP-alcohol phosphatidyltransferase family protein n=1 Tax=Longirhabdus pacifica TaxID=2305227 RepID=UPI0010088370|nr:CDP-alcohol phosphatidyltransferase family protein [Longirhabdus pacifica]